MLRLPLLALCLSSASCFSPAAMRPSIATVRLSPFCSRAAAPCAQAGDLNVPDSPKSGSLADNLDAVYRFSRPHTIRGTLLACFTGVGRALVESPEFIGTIPSLLPRAMLGVLALLLGNLFIVGINQIYDVRPACSTRAIPICQHEPSPACPEPHLLSLTFWLLAGRDRPDQQALPPRGGWPHLAARRLGARPRLRCALPRERPPPPRPPPGPSAACGGLHSPCYYAHSCFKPY